MTAFYDELETRSASDRETAQLAAVNAQLDALRAHDPAFSSYASLTSLSDLATLPVMRKQDLHERQASNPPFGGLLTRNATHVFQSPGPIYEPGGGSRDWWRFARFLHACGIGADDIVQNCFGYHLTPAGTMFENGARAVGAAVLPAGTGQTELQVRAAADIGTTAYAGTPDYLKVILEKADTMGETLKITKAAVSGGALFPQLRDYYTDRGITCICLLYTSDAADD